MSQTSGDYAEYQIEIPPSFVALYSDCLLYTSDAADE